MISESLLEGLFTKTHMDIELFEWFVSAYKKYWELEDIGIQESKS